MNLFEYGVAKLDSPVSTTYWAGDLKKCHEFIEAHRKKTQKSLLIRGRLTGCKNDKNGCLYDVYPFDQSRAMDELKAIDKKYKRLHSKKDISPDDLTGGVNKIQKMILGS